MERLDQFTVDIEFLLISVVQGVALAALASFAANPFIHLQIQFWPYIITAFIFILIFWSQAIIHVLSFIHWPIDLAHNFLYFLMSFVEVMAFSQITNPFGWFMFIFFFVLIAGFLYLYDLALIKKSVGRFNSKAGKKLYKDIYKDQMFQIKFFVPSGLAFNLLALFWIYFHPQSHIIFGVLQVVFGLIILFESIRSFKKRSLLIGPSSP